MAGVEDKSLKPDIFVKTTVYPPAEREREAPPRRQIRRSVRRLESRAKVDGSAEYMRLALDRLYGLLSSSEQQEFLESAATTP